MARSFDGSDDILTCSSTGLGSVTGGNITLAFIVKLNDTTDGSVIDLRRAGNAFCCQINAHGGEWFYSTDSGFRGFGGGSASTSDNWTVIALTKASGTATPRLHKYVFDTGTWTHTDAGGTITGDSAPLDTNGTVNFGKFMDASEFRNMELDVCAVFERVLTDSEVEQLAYSLPAWQSAAPSAGWLFDQAATTQLVNDWTGGGCNESSKTGTAVSTSSVPVFGYGQPVLVPFTAASAQTIAMDTAIESDVAFAITGAKSGAITVAVESDIAIAIAASKDRILGIASESDIAIPFGGAASIQVQTAIESDVALPITVGHVGTTFTLNTPRVREGLEVYTGLWRYYSLERGVTLLVKGTVVTETRYPWQGDLENYDFVYLGGHIYEITAAEATTLINAGYGSFIT